MNGPQTQYPHLNKAPIVEAIVDFRVKLPTDFRVESFAPLRDRLSDHYPKFGEQRHAEFQFQQQTAKAPVTSARDLGVQGHLYRSEDGKNIVQFRLNGFTFSRLHPYTKWEEIFEEGWRLWGMYVETAKPVDISRIAVRYINRLQLPMPMPDLSKFLKVPPLIAPGWPQQVNGFLSRITLSEPDSGLFANVLQALEPSKDPRYVPVIFDIDVYRRITLNPNDVMIREWFGKLREMKNRIFFNGLKPETIELFK